jgi:hypothetical protein
MALTNAEKQASWRERHLKNENGTKLRALSSFSTPAPGRSSSGSPVTRVLGSVSHQGGAASAERRITHQVSAKALKQYYDAE